MAAWIRQRTFGVLTLLSLFLMVHPTWAETQPDNAALLRQAVVEGDADQVTTLLGQSGLDLNAADTDGETALMLAAQTDQLEIARLLIAKGADLNKTDAGGKTPLLDAVLTGNATLVTLLCEHGANTDVPETKHGDTPLMLAAWKGRTEIATALLHHKAQPNLADAQGHTALFMAADKGHQDIVAVLKTYGAAPNEADRGMLWEAAHRGDVPTVQNLLAAGFAGDKPNADGDTPLMAACMVICTDFQGADLAKALLASGASVNAQDKDGMTPLLFAVTSGKPATAQTLLAAGADPKLRTAKTGRTALMTVADGSPSLSPDVQMTIAKELLEARAPVDTEDNDGETALIFAAREKQPEMVTLLLAYDAAVDHRDSEGRTALMYAAQRGQVKIVRTLIQAGADVQARDREGKTALWWSSDPLTPHPKSVSDSFAQTRHQIALILKQAGARE